MKLLDRVRVARAGRPTSEAAGPPPFFAGGWSDSEPATTSAVYQEAERATGPLPTPGALPPTAPTAFAVHEVGVGVTFSGETTPDAFLASPLAHPSHGPLIVFSGDHTELLGGYSATHVVRGPQPGGQ